MFYQKIKNRVSSRLLAKFRVSQVFWEPIKDRVSPRSVLLKAVYLEALLYTKETDQKYMDAAIMYTRLMYTIVLNFFVHFFEDK